MRKVLFAVLMLAMAPAQAVFFRSSATDYNVEETNPNRWGVLDSSQEQRLTVSWEDVPENILVVTSISSPDGAVDRAKSFKTFLEAATNRNHCVKAQFSLEDLDRENGFLRSLLDHCGFAFLGEVAEGTYSFILQKKHFWFTPVPERPGHPAESFVQASTKSPDDATAQPE